MRDDWGYLCVLLLLFVPVGLWTTRRRSSKPLPGPKPLPIVGNIRDLVFEHECEVYARWSETYGDLIYFEVLGQPLLYVHSSEAAHDLFDKRSSVYSGRYITPMMKLMGLADWPLVIMDYGSLWKKHRKIFHQRFEPRRAAEFHPLHASATARLLQNLAKTPEDFYKHYRHMAGSVLIETTYGIKVDKEDPLLSLAEEAIQAFSDISKPGAFFVDIFPILRFWPEWAPFGSFKKQALSWRQMLKDLREIPWAIVKQRLGSGKASNSFATSMLTETIEGEITMTEYDFQGAAATTYGGTYLSRLDPHCLSLTTTFTLAMMLHPEIQKKAQEELDVVIGRRRLPQLTDRPSLGFCDALLKESLRWSPPVPMGVPHLLGEDDIYRGCKIPKGTIVFANTWAILHDKRFFANPESFDPDRYVKNPELPDPKASGVFGFGRRICPGRHLAETLLWLAMVRILHSFSIRTDGDRSECPHLFESGFTR
ncbi:hypothetical protein M422DRAFT_188633 [Sphaerobolus stellatus SS14]|uniref:Cytochrome P450 n=1 Tax=Sphaerobolus stellatus (strain SS14) TaxID=990650 RepID=A0A0C9UW05_SPHS4|nr:hypothetical protein M422DRAFT_188633 [Sphaerobolus stellatus SS14]